jgi:toxin ParE1/3/4
MANYYLTNKAVDDLSDIWNYTLLKWSENQADKCYGLLIDSFQEIAENPDIGKNYDGIASSLYGIHANRHIIFYRKMNIDKIEITRVLHDSMDLKERILE